MGRLHKRSTVLEEIGRLREAGLPNINIDLIAGLPHQTADSWAFSLAETIATGVPHVSVYMLEVDEDSRLGRELIAGGARYHAHLSPMTMPPRNSISKHARCWRPQVSRSTKSPTLPASPRSSRNGELHSNQSRHNLKYRTRQPYIGFGVDAHSMLDAVWGRAPSARPSRAQLGCCPGSSYSGFAIAADLQKDERYEAVRFATPDSLDAYMNRAPHTVTPVSAQAAIEESFFLGLRLNRGIELNGCPQSSGRR